MMRTSYLKLMLTVVMLAFGLTGLIADEAASCYWWQKPIQVDNSLGGPNILVNQTTGLNISYVYSNSNGYNAFGYFTYSGDTGAIIEQQTVNFGSDGSAYIGQFESGTHIGTWLNTDYGTFYTIPSLNDPYGFRARQMLYPFEGNPVIGLEGGPTTWFADYRELVVSFKPVDHAPTGQPLPGVLLSGLIGLGVAGIAAIRKRKKNLV
ncbi:MAG: hypothetical protein PHH77_04455 [Victivallaceae bacterium]|nr:hypothetical protein [Victivallaceae bacterium]